MQNVSNVMANARVDSRISKPIVDKWQSILDELESKLRGAINRHTYKSAREAISSTNSYSNQVCYIYCLFDNHYQISNVSHNFYTH